LGIGSSLFGIATFRKYHSRPTASWIVIDDYIDVSYVADLIFELYNSFPAVLHDLDRLIKTSPIIDHGDPTVRSGSVPISWSE